jgi:hypothetical protein
VLEIGAYQKNFKAQPTQHQRVTVQAARERWNKVFNQGGK